MDNDVARLAAAPPGAAAVAVAMRGVTKRFPGVVANDDVSFEVERGEVHALLGENGAGKTTLMNILTGLYRPDEGEIEVGGRTVELNSPRDAIAAGIGMVHQHFRLVETLTVAENIALADRQAPFLLRGREAERRVELTAEALHMPVDPGAKIWQLSVGEQQRVEIMKAVRSGSRVLILDEPTAVLTPQEAQELFRTLRVMAAEGHSVVVITHKLHEVIGFFPVLLGEPPLTHYPRAGDAVVHIGTLELTTAVAFDVGVFLLVAGSLVELIHQLTRLVEEPRP